MVKIFWNIQYDLIKTTQTFVKYANIFQCHMGLTIQSFNLLVYNRFCKYLKIYCIFSLQCYYTFKLKPMNLRAFQLTTVIVVLYPKS